MVRFAPLLLLALLGCASASPTRNALEVDVKDIPIATEPVNHCYYIGSDPEYHYFCHAHFKEKKWFKVKKSKLALRRTFDLDATEKTPYIWNPDVAVDTSASSADSEDDRRLLQGRWSVGLAHYSMPGRIFHTYEGDQVVIESHYVPKDNPDRPPEIGSTRFRYWLDTSQSPKRLYRVRMDDPREEVLAFTYEFRDGRLRLTRDYGLDRSMLPEGGMPDPLCGLEILDRIK